MCVCVCAYHSSGVYTRLTQSFHCSVSLDHAAMAVLCELPCFQSQFLRNMAEIHTYLYDLGKDLPEAEGERVSLPFQQAVSLLGSFQP